jgi:hypothetical protein
MKSSSALTAGKTVIRWLRWAAVLALVCSALSDLVYFALGPQARVLRPAPLAVVQNLVFMFLYALKGTAFVVVGAMIAPRSRLTTAIVLAAVYLPLSLWNHVLSRVSLAELVLLEGRGNYGYFTLEALGAVLGVVYIFRSEKAEGSVASVPPSQLLLLNPPPGSAGTKPALTAAKTVTRCLRWAVVLVLICSTLGELVYSVLGAVVFSALGPEASVVRPAPLAVVQGLVRDFLFWPAFLFVVAGATIAPRFRFTTALVLAALHVAHSFWGHVLATGGPWWFWTINYTHFTLEAFGSVLGVLYIFWSERARATVATLPPDPPPR